MVFRIPTKSNNLHGLIWFQVTFPNNNNNNNNDNNDNIAVLFFKKPKVIFPSLYKENGSVGSAIIICRKKVVELSPGS